MNYQTVLQNYLPVEQGDFMLKYEIDDRGYAIYSPEKGSFSCIELHGFSELTPWQLAFLLSLDMQQMKEQDEFSLSVCCKREKLLSYLFDVEESETTLKTTMRGVMNRVLPNVLEFKEILKNKKTLPFELMQNYIKDSRVDYQRNLSTLSKAYHHPCDAFCEEVLELICNHIGE